MRVKSFAISMILMFCLCSTQVHATLITFNSAEIPVNPSTGNLYNNPMYDPGYLYPVIDPQTGQTVNTLYLPGFSDGILHIDGFTFSGDHFHIINLPYAQNYGGSPDNGSFYIYAERNTVTYLTLTSSESRPFSLVSFEGGESYRYSDEAAANGSPVARTITVVGTTVTGSTISASFTLDGIIDGTGGSPDFQTFVFPLDWHNLTTVTFSGHDDSGQSGGFSLDNINVMPGPSVVSIINRQLMVNSSAFTIKGVVYSPVPVGESPEAAPFGDYFTSNYGAIYDRDLPLLRQMGANTIRLMSWSSNADHTDFLDSAYNGGISPLYIIAGYWINADLDIDPASPSNVRSQLKADFRQMVSAHKNHPAILMWSIGSDLNSPEMFGGNLDDLFSLINEMAEAAHAEEGVNYHPVTTALFDYDILNTIINFEASVPALDIWGANVYRGDSFGILFNDVRANSSKPLIILEYGIDAYDAVSNDEYTGTDYQAEYAASLWNEMAANSDICVGGSIMEYSDEWWRGALATDSNCFDNDPGYHGLCGYSSSADPDGYANEEWRGLMRTVNNGSNPDIMEPRAVYYYLQALWTSPVTLHLNNDDLYTRSRTTALKLACAESNECVQMQFSNDGAIWSTPASYSVSSNWTLTTGDGLKTVYARVMDSAGNWSSVFSDNIVLDMTSPVTTASPSGGTYTASQPVSLSCSDGTGAGCDKTYYTTDGTTPTAASNIYAGPIIISAATTLKFFSTDLAGNSETVKTQTYAIDSVAPSGAITINNGAIYTGSRTATLTLSCTDNVGCYQMQFSNDNVAWSTLVTYATTRTWSVTSGDGEKTVYVKFKDTAGNWSAIYSDTIILDMTRPMTSASPSGGFYPSGQSVTLQCSDGGSGCDKTYYTTDGSTPTTASSIYAGSVLITTSTTLKYFSTDRAGNTEIVRTQTYTLDTTPPTGGITINSGVAYTRSRTATLTLNCSDDRGCSQMQFSNDNATWSTPVTYSATRTWSLTAGDGEKTVYVKFKDTAGNWSVAYSDIIMLDMTVPVTTASPAGGTYNSSQSVTLTCGDGAGAGCDKTYYTTDGTTPTTASNVYAGPIIISAATTLKFFSTDLAGNAETVKTQAYAIDSVAPSGAITINGGAIYTGSRTATLTLSCTDNVGCYQMQFSNDNVAWSNPGSYSTSRIWSMTSGSGEKTVYVRFKDSAGNWSAVYSDTIILDVTRPVNGTLTAVAGTEQITLSWSSFSDALSGIAGYRLVYSTVSSPTSCSTGTEIYSGPDVTYVHTGLVSGTTYYYRVCATDNAGNVSTGASRSVVP